jgi:lipopolysaccharide transport system ATP-binding protein
MSKIAIKVEDVSKQYRLGKIGTGTFSHDVNRWWHTVRGKEDPYLKIGELNDRSKKGESEYVWALKDIAFDIKQGDVVGIIGRNGAGKSTLLKLLSRTTLPTTGSIKIRGRVASLLEVGTGFHPELTGRENIFLNGAILGMTKAEIRNKFDEIVDFSGVEKYIDTPVKRYSSGMYVRLAFAVAAHLEPEILVVDEVLAVGDAEFQKKALGKMQNVSQNEGRTVLFVSHNMGAIKQLCSRGILLKNGIVKTDSSIEQTIRSYFELEDSEVSQKPPVSKYRDRKIEHADVQIVDIFVNGDDEQIPEISMHSEIILTVRLQAKTRITNANLSFGFNNAEGLFIGGGFSLDDNVTIDLEKGLSDVTIKIANNPFSPGSYFLGIGVNQSTQTIAWDVIKHYPIFLIENNNQYLHYSNRTWGLIHIRSQWSINKISL